jgi:hypothetical protein
VRVADGRGDAIDVEGLDSKLTYRVQSIDALSKDEMARDAEGDLRAAISVRMSQMTVAVSSRVSKTGS